MSADTDRISMLNDEPRKHLLGGGVVITAGIAELRQDALERLVKFQIARNLSALFLHFRGC
jgi:hypothetical protein